MTDPRMAGAHIRQARHRRLLTLHQLGDMAGLGHSTVGNAETGRVLTARTLAALRAVLELPDEFTPDGLDPDLGKRRGQAGKSHRRVPARSMLEPPDTSWAADAPCATAPVGAFDPIGDEEDLADAWDRTRAAWYRYCSHCPLVTPCRTRAVKYQHDGIWGGALFRTFAGSTGGYGRVEHRLLAEMVHVDVDTECLQSESTEPYSKVCAGCAETFMVNPRKTGPRPIYCSKRCSHLVADRNYRDRQRAAGRARRLGTSNTYGPTQTRAEPVATPATDFETFKRSLRLDLGRR